MISLLTDIVNLMVCWVETACVLVINLFVVDIAALISAVLALLPSFPSVTLPTQFADAVGWVGYCFPLDWLVANVALFLVLAVAWWGLSIPLRWAKAVRGSE